MPLTLPDRLPAIDLLKEENIFVIDSSRASSQDIRPLRIVILNLMPIKITTETDLIRVLSNSPLQLELSFMKIKSHTSKNTPIEHMKAFYKDFELLKHEKFDGMIITGAPVEHLEYEEVNYWDEMQDIFAWAKTHVGFPDAAVDRIVPPVHCDVPLDVAVEEYFEWDVEKSSFVGDIPTIKGMSVVDNLEAYLERKLFTLNTGHATAAYLGKIRGYQTINESIADPEIFATVKAAMQQSGEGLIKKFGFDHDAHFAYIEKILKRFQNPFLKDECDRVGREPGRKLAANDRIILPMMTAKNFGLPYDKLLLACGGALRYDNPEDPQSVEIKESIATNGLEATIIKLTGLKDSDPIVAEIKDAYDKVMNFAK